VRGYIFTYNSSFKLQSQFQFNKTQSIGNEDEPSKTIPLGMNIYFSNTDKYQVPINLILNIVPRHNRLIPIDWSFDLIIRTNDGILTRDLNPQKTQNKQLKTKHKNKHSRPLEETSAREAEVWIEKPAETITKNIKSNVLRVLNDYLKEQHKQELEEHVLNIITTAPLNSLSLPIKYTLHPRELNSNDVIIYYDYKVDITKNTKKDSEELLDRESVYRRENEFITSFEDAFENSKSLYRLYYDYNNIAEKIEKIFKNNDIKYKQTKDYIEFQIKDLRKAEEIGIDYSIIDFII
jgi:hypothetical protein